MHTMTPDFWLHVYTLAIWFVVCIMATCIGSIAAGIRFLCYKKGHAPLESVVFVSIVAFLGSVLGICFKGYDVVKEVLKCQLN